MFVHDTSNGPVGHEVEFDETEEAFRERVRHLGGLRGSLGGAVAAATGAVAEIAVERWLTDFRVGFLRSSALRADLWLPKANLRVDVKAKLRAARPHPHHNVAVIAEQFDAPPDWYVFVSLVSKPVWRAWIVGAVESARLKSEGRLWKAGERDEDNGTVMWGACRTMEIRSIMSPDAAIARFSESAW